MPRYVAIAAALLVSASARAHAPPEGRALAFPTQATSDAGAPTVITNRGLFFPDGGELEASFGVRCSEAYGATAASDVQAFYDSAGSLVVATTATLTSSDATGSVVTTAVTVRASDDRGCSWHEASGLPALPLGGFTRSLEAPDTLFLSTFDYQQTSRIFISQDAGRSWQVRATNAPATVYKTLLAGPEQRVYASGDRFDVEQQKLLPLWASSLDEGATWREVVTELPREPLGLHPQDANVVFAREELELRTTPPRDRILRSSDAGNTFVAVAELARVRAFAATPDASSLWVGTDEGLYRSRDGGESFEQIRPDTIHRVTCLYYRDEQLWTCANMGLNISGVWMSSDAGESFTELLTFEPTKTRADHRVLCEGEALPICEEPWRDYARELLGESFDAGTPTHAPDAGAAAGSDAEAQPELEDAAPSEHAADASRNAAEVAGNGAGAPSAEGCSLGSAQKWQARSDAVLLSLLGALACLRTRRRVR